MLKIEFKIFFSYIQLLGSRMV